MGYFDKNYDAGSDVTGNTLTDDSLVVLNLTKHIHEKVSIWAESGQYSEGQDNYALGVNITF